MVYAVSDSNDSAAINYYDDEIISIENENQIIESDENSSGVYDNDNLENNSIKSFSYLADLIDNAEENSTIYLNESCKFNSSLDNASLIDGVVISKNITVIGKNNPFIDGSGIARGFNINSGCCVILKNILFKNGYTKNGGGGAIIVGKNSNLLVDNCTFHDNKVYNANGGAIYGLDSSNITVNNTEFYGNRGIRVSSLAWKEYKCGMGSVICMRIGSNLKLYNSIIRDNIGSLTTILIITWDDVNTDQSTLYVENCLFENNSAKSNGVIYLDEFGIAKIINSTFRHNIVTSYGSVVVFDTSISAIVENCTFEQNCAVSGGAIFITSYDSKYRSHVKIEDSAFIKNSATQGGAIVSKYCVTEINNVSFIENYASLYGGAIYSRTGSISIVNSYFSENVADYGGGLYLKTNKNTVFDSSFVKNYAFIAGGAIYSTMKKISTKGCIYSKNIAFKASKIYGAYFAKITKYISANGRVKLKIKLSSLWKMPISQKIKIKLPGYTSKWLKTNKKGKLQFRVPKNKAVSKKKLSIKMYPGVCYIKKYAYKRSANITLPDEVKKSSKLKISIRNHGSKKLIKKTKFKVKIYSGNKFKTFNLKTNSKGIIKINMNSFSKGNHKILFYLNNNKYYINKKVSFEII